jgi:branched-subunit amino acid transport protein
VTAVWTTIVCLAGANALIRATGPVLAGGRDLPAPLARFIAFAIPALMAALIVTGVFVSARDPIPALMAALIVTGVFVSARDLVLDARAGGLAIAAVALVLRAPLLVVVVLSAAGTALLRAL